MEELYNDLMFEINLQKTLLINGALKQKIAAKTIINILEPISDKILIFIDKENCEVDSKQNILVNQIKDMTLQELAILINPPAMAG